MGSFRRAQLRGSEELFRPSDAETQPQAQFPPLPLQEEVEVPVAGVSPSNGSSRATAVTPVPNLPGPGERALRLPIEDIELLAEAVQQLKFPAKTLSRPSVDEFERLEELRQKLLAQL